MKKIFNAQFSSKDWDEFLTKWLSGSVEQTLLNEWAHVLMYDSRFREDFCEFIKSLREPGWSRESKLSRGEES